jgi:hypothetical protein
LTAADMRGTSATADCAERALVSIEFLNLPKAGLVKWRKFAQTITELSG